MLRFLQCALLVVVFCSTGCSQQKTAVSTPAAAAAGQAYAALSMFDNLTFYEVTAPDGKLQLLAKKLLLIFDGIRIEKVARGAAFRSSFQHPDQGPVTTNDAVQFGSTLVDIKQAGRPDKTIDVAINGFKFRLVDNGDSVEIDGKTYKFDEPHTLVVDKDGKVTEKKE